MDSLIQHWHGDITPPKQTRIAAELNSTSCNQFGPMLRYSRANLVRPGSSAVFETGLVLERKKFTTIVEEKISGPRESKLLQAKAEAFELHCYSLRFYNMYANWRISLC